MAIDRQQIIEQVSSLALQNNGEGLISAFSVLLCRVPSALWNNFAERLTRSIKPELQTAAEQMLINAAHECGYHTGYGILHSQEWQRLVAPMVEQVPEDVLHGTYALVTGMGWAKSEIIRLVPGEQAVVRAYDYYEADVVEYGQSSKFSAYMLQGITAAFMDLAYGDPYPNGLYTFTSTQTKGIERGDEYGESVVVRA